MNEEKADVSVVRKSFQHFSWIDYSVFVVMLTICGGIGIYFGFVKKQKSTQDYLMGGRNMKLVPVCFSLVASFISGISLLGTPTEVYIYGTAYLFFLTGAVLMSVIIFHTFLPVLHELKLISAYEYTKVDKYTKIQISSTIGGLIAKSDFFQTTDGWRKFHKQFTRLFLDTLNNNKVEIVWEFLTVHKVPFCFITSKYLELRYDKRLRVFGSVIFSVYLISWLPIVIYVPALAFNQVTGVNIHIVTPIVCFVCIFYTCLGGLKAVVWTDVIQTIVMVGAMILVNIKGTVIVGGLDEVIIKNRNTSRIELPSVSFDFTDRHSIWSVSIGSMFYWIGNIAVNQAMMQRFLSLPDLKQSRRAVWGFLGGITVIVLICAYSGLLAFARYYDCDPLNSKLALAKDQILPLLVMDVLSEWKGMPGIFVAGVFSAALSSLSTGLNSMSAVVLEDFWKPFFKPLTHKQTQVLVRAVVVILGVICVALVFVVEKLGSVLQLTMSLSSASMGPLAGIFLMGIFLPFINSTCALGGGTTGLISAWWLVAQSQLAQARGSLHFREKDRFTHNCTYVFEQPVNNIEYTSSEIPYLYRISYLWVTAFGCIVTVVVACAASLLSDRPSHDDERLFAPIVRKWLKKKKRENELNLHDANGYD